MLLVLVKYTCDQRVPCLKFVHIKILALGLTELKRARQDSKQLFLVQTWAPRAHTHTDTH